MQIMIMLLYLTVDTPEHMDTLQTDVDRVSDWPSYSKCGKDKIYAINPTVCSISINPPPQQSMANHENKYQNTH